MIAGRPPFPVEQSAPEAVADAALVGRDRACAAIRAALAHTRVLTLLGPGGVGKTSLALRVAEAVAERFPDGVAIVSLAALADAALVLPLMAQTLGVRDGGSRPLREVVQEVLHAQRKLLLLDNMEHVLEAVPDVGALLDQCAHLTILATSRAPLGLPGEHRYVLEPLGLPDAAVEPTVGVVADAPAVQLFVRRAQAVAPDFTLTPANAAVVAALCRRLDGLPLAIELAAGQLPHLTVATLTARLDETLPLLTGSGHSFVERHQTMWRAIAWSYHLLAEREQRLFRQLAVFAGGCMLEAVAAACDAVSEDAGAVERAVAALADKSLVRLEERPEWPAPRLMLLETIRSYALERLVSSGEDEDCRRRHARYYVTWAEQAEPALTGPDQAVWGARLEQEHDNLRAVLRWVLAPEAEQGHAARSAERRLLGLRLGAALWRFWYMRGYLTEGRNWLEQLASCPPGDDVETRRAHARVLTGAGLLALYQGDRDRAALLCGRSLPIFAALGDDNGRAQALFGLGRLEDSVALYRRVGDTRDIAEPLLDLALAAFHEGEDARTTALYEESLELARARGDQRGTALALGGLGLDATFRKGDYRRATALHEESLRLYREVGDTRGVAIALSNLGEVAALAGDYGRARVAIEECLPLRRQVGDQFGLADSLRSLAKVVGAQGDYRRAAELHEESVRLFRALGDKRWMTYPLRDLAGVLYQRGAYAQAGALFDELLALSHEIGDRHAQAYALDGLGLVAAAQGEIAQAWARHEEALDVYRALDDRAGLPDALSHLGMVALQQGDPARAGDLLRESLALYRALGSRRAVATVLCRLGDVARAEGDLARARLLYGESLTLNHDLGLTAEVARCLAGAAACAAAAGETVSAARLAGAAEALQESTGAVATPAEHADAERLREALCVALGEEAVTAAWAVGRAMGLEEGVSIALEALSWALSSTV
jgi:predicted ATPase/Tfp pilus assembly protein PilF